MISVYVIYSLIMYFKSPTNVMMMYIRTKELFISLSFSGPNYFIKNIQSKKYLYFKYFNHRLECFPKIFYKFFNTKSFEIAFPSSLVHLSFYQKDKKTRWGSRDSSQDRSLDSNPGDKSRT